MASDDQDRARRESRAAQNARYCRALYGTSLPAAMVDLDALEANIDRLLQAPRAMGKTVRLASKSLRCPELLRLIAERGAGTVRGVMTYGAAETAFLARTLPGSPLSPIDLLLGYPTMQQADLQLLAALGRDGQKAPDSPKAQVVAAAVADCVEHLDALARAAAVEGGVIPVVLDVDMSYRPLGTGPFSPHLGVRRSPLRDTAEVVALAQRIANTRGLRFHGLLFYEAQIAGLTDRNPFTRATNVVKRAIKARSGPDVVRRRKECLQALFAHGLRPQVVNGGGTGSVAFSAQDPSLTEVTIGSGFLDSLLFDYYQDLSLSPAAFFALQVVRCPAPGIVTCHGGGYVASGEAGPDRLPRPYLPDGLELLDLEGAGEVQTPLRVRGGGSSSALPCLGDPVFFRHAKAGELAEHFGEYLLVRGDRVVARAPTYRGLGQCFLG